jgi:hypothetical protein
MNWMNELGGVLEQYRNTTSDRAPATVQDDFDRFSKVAPREEVSVGLAEAFRSDKTPPFPQMASQMFGRANGSQRAGLLNMLIATVGPMIVQQVLARRQRQGSGGPASGPGQAEGGLLDRILKGGGPPKVTPEDVKDLRPEEVEEIAREAEKKDPSVIDRVSEIYAQQPELLKVLGGAALAIALGRVASRRNTL